MADLFTFGEALALFLASDTDSVATARQFTLEPAGAEANVAVAVTRLGLVCMFQSRLGQDQLGDVIIAELQKEGVDCLSH
ncbi:MAG: PfkB family carbohydrate kinase [Actinomycetota bacterium]